MITREVKPANGRESFRGKAYENDHHTKHGKKTEHKIELMSYGRKVATIYTATNDDNPGVSTLAFCRNWGGYSMTTLTHVNGFRAMHGLDHMTKKDWEELPVND